MACRYTYTQTLAVSSFPIIFLYVWNCYPLSVHMYSNIKSASKVLFGFPNFNFLPVAQFSPVLKVYPILIICCSMNWTCHLFCWELSSALYLSKGFHICHYICTGCLRTFSSRTFLQLLHFLVVISVTQSYIRIGSLHPCKTDWLVFIWQNIFDLTLSNFGLSNLGFNFFDIMFFIHHLM